MRGFCIAQKPFPVIIINPKDSPYGRIFTIIHELAHIALGKSIVQPMGDKEDRPQDWSQTEVFCNEVAGAVLVPAAELSEKVNLPTLETDLPQLSKHFRVSSEVIMRRLETLAYISQEDYQEYRNNLLEKVHRELANWRVLCRIIISFLTLLESTSREPLLRLITSRKLHSLIYPLSFLGAIQNTCLKLRALSSHEFIVQSKSGRL